MRIRLIISFLFSIFLFLEEGLGEVEGLFYVNGNGNAPQERQNDFRNRVLQLIHDQAITIENFKDHLALQGDNFQMPGVMAIAPQNGVNRLAFYFGLKRRHDGQTNLAHQPNSHTQHHTERQLLHAAMQNQQVLNGQSHVYLYTPKSPCFVPGNDNGRESCLEHYHTLVANNPNLHLVVFFNIHPHDTLAPIARESNADRKQAFSNILQNLRNDSINNIIEIILSFRDTDHYNLQDKIRISRVLLGQDNIVNLSNNQIEILRTIFNRFIQNNWQRIIQVEMQQVNLIEHVYNSIYGINNRLIFKIINI